jgi:hypothetical protein
MLNAPASFLAWAAHQNRDGQIAALLELTHPQFIEPVRAVSDLKDITVNGIPFIAFPFSFQFPGEGETIPRVEISIQNVDKRIGHGVRNVKGAIAATLSAVLREDPDQLIVEVPRLYLVDVTVTNAFVSGTLTGRRNANSAWPGVRATPELTPGLHWS